MRIFSDRQGLRVESISDYLRGQIDIEAAQSSIHQRYDFRPGSTLQRDTLQTLTGLSYTPSDRILFEAKASTLTQQDRNGRKNQLYLDYEQDVSRLQRQSATRSLTVSWGDQQASLYGQTSIAERPPSLLEEFGNGSIIRPSPDLAAESLQHSEIGIFYANDSLQIASSLYQDRTRDKIVFVPILANASKALNVAETATLGWDISLTGKHHDDRFTLKGSLLQALDLSLAQRTRKLPSTPEQVIVLDWQRRWDSQWLSSFTSRYRSDVYRDLGNTVVLPAAWLHDLNLDYRSKPFQWGLSLPNITDTRDLPINSSSGSAGRTGLSDISGAPLPGRQWVVSWVYEFIPKHSPEKN